MSTKEELKNIWNLLSQSTNIPVLLLAGGLTMVGAGFLNPIFALYFMEKGISFVGLGIIFSAASALSLFLKPVIGHVSDTYGRRKLIVGFSLVVSLLTPLYLFIRSVLGLALVHSGRTVLSESSQPAFSAMVGDVAPQEGRATLFGFYSSVQSIVYVVALFGGGAILAAGFSLEGLFYITSAFFLISSIVLAIFLKETIEVGKVTQPIETTSRLQRFLTGLRNLATDRSTLGLMLYSFFFTFALRVYPVYIPLFVVKVFGIGREFVGPIVAVSWITYAIIQPYGGWLSDKWGKRKVFILLGLALIVLFNFAMAISPTLVWVVVFWALIGIGDGMFRPVMSALIVDIVPPTRRGAYFGTIGSVGGIASIVAPLVYGIVAELYSIRWTFLITSVFYALAMITVGILVKEGKVIGEGE
jgi:MFS family permease